MISQSPSPGVRASEPWRWNRRKWLALIGLTVLGQVALLWIFGQALPSRFAPARFVTQIQLAVEPWATQRLAARSDLSDPASFALPSLHGFSGAAWLRYTTPGPPTVDWSEEPTWLELPAASLGQTWSRLADATIFAPLRVADKPLPDSITVAPRTDNAPIQTRSALRVEGALAAWSLVTPAVLPSWPRAELLTNTVVSLAIDDTGTALSASVLEGCGLKEADQFGLNWAFHAQFRSPEHPRTPRPSPGSVVRGRLVFQWHTAPPPLPPAGGVPTEPLPAAPAHAIPRPP